MDFVLEVADRPVMDNIHLDISVLGPLQIRLGAELITRFEFERVRALSLYLAVEAVPHERISLVYMFWPDAPPQTGLANLRQTLAALRRALQDKHQETPFLLVTPSTICLNPDSDYSLDLETFSRLIKETEQHSHRRLGACSSCMGKLEQAIGLFRGDIAVGLGVDSQPFEEWLLHKQEQIHLQVMRALANLTDYYLRHNRLTEAIHLAQRQLTLDSLCDIAHHQLILALAADGQRHAALQHCEQYKALLEAELGLSLPAEVSALCQELMSETWERATTCLCPVHNLPKPLTPFIGYEQELSLIRERLSSAECRLLTLTGIVGSGKSRMALEAAWSEIPNFRDGIYYVELEKVKANGMLAAIAKTILPAFSENENEAQAAAVQITAWLREKELLLILDHFDCLIESDTPALRLLLREVPGLQIVVTSQERLKVRGETFVELQGLTYPDRADVREFEAYDAVRFFLQSVSRWQPDFTLRTIEDREAIVHICRHTGGIPRALELYAYTANLFPLSQISEEFEKISGWRELLSRALPKRQRSMKDMFKFTWRRLSREEQRVLVSLSVFNESFTMMAAQVVTQAQPTVLLSLHAKSCLQSLRCSQAAREPIREEAQEYLPLARYKIPGLFRFYILQTLEQEPVLLNSLRQAHAFYYIHFLRQNVEAIANARCRRCIARFIQSEKENIGQAWSWALEQELPDVIAQIENDLALFYIFESQRRNSVQEVEPAFLPGLAATSFLNGSFASSG